jgi:hypothetical protein
MLMPERPRSTWFLSRRIFLAGISATYLVAFGSLWVQVEGLFGERGIAPIARTLEEYRAVFGQRAVLRVPSLLWWSAGDGALNLLCACGIVAALLAVLGIVPRLALALAWVLYLSLAGPGEPFLGFQWDALLLEAGFLAIFLAPLGVRPFARGERAPSQALLFLVRWLLFRLMALSGAVKLSSGDPSWLGLDALDYHYWTQPLPHRISHFVHGLPEWTREVSVAVMFAIELGVPLLVFGTRSMRLAAAGATALLMGLIFATGNYGFFNLLTLVLCAPLVDDRAWRALLRRKAPPLPAEVHEPARWRRAASALFALLVVALTSTSAAYRLDAGRWVPAPLGWLHGHASALQSFNAYGLFSVMTKERPEIVVEGSRDGVEWLADRFEHKPLELERAPTFAGLHMPRLDWQMWFAALETGGPRRPRWYADFLRRLLEGSPEVLELLREDPFAGNPPHLLRSTVYSYRFSSPAERAQGTWWRRSDRAEYFPTVTLKDGELAAVR